MSDDYFMTALKLVANNTVALKQALHCAMAMGDQQL